MMQPAVLSVARDSSSSYTIDQNATYKLMFANANPSLKLEVVRIWPLRMLGGEPQRAF